MARQPPDSGRSGRRPRRQKGVHSSGDEIRFRTHANLLAAAKALDIEPIVAAPQDGEVEVFPCDILVPIGMETSEPPDDELIAYADVHELVARYMFAADVSGLNVKLPVSPIRTDGWSALAAESLNAGWVSKTPVRIDRANQCKTIQIAVPSHRAESEGDVLFQVSFTDGEGVWYRLVPTGGPTLVDAYERVLGGKLTLKEVARMKSKRHLDTCYERLLAEEARHYATYVPEPPPADSSRLFSDHLIWGDLENVDALARRVAAIAVYSSELAFDCPTLDSAFGWRTAHAPEERAYAWLGVLARLRPLIQDRVVHPVSLHPRLNSAMETWLGEMLELDTEFHDRLDSSMRRREGGENSEGGGEHATDETCGLAHEVTEVFAQSLAAADLCSARPLFLDGRMCELADMDARVRTGRGVQGRAERGLARIVVPNLERCPLDDLLALRSGSEYLSQLRGDIQSAGRHLERAGAASVSGEDTVRAALAEIARVRVDAFRTELNRSGLAESVRGAGTSFVMGLFVSLAFGGGLVSSGLSGVAAEAATQLATVRGRLRMRGRQRSALRVYSGFLQASE